MNSKLLTWAYMNGGRDGLVAEVFDTLLPLVTKNARYFSKGGVAWDLLALRFFHPNPPLPRLLIHWLWNFRFNWKMPRCQQLKLFPQTWRKSVQFCLAHLASAHIFTYSELVCWNGFLFEDLLHFTRIEFTYSSYSVNMYSIMLF